MEEELDNLHEELGDTQLSLAVYMARNKEWSSGASRYIKWLDKMSEEYLAENEMESYYAFKDCEKEFLKAFNIVRE